MNKIGKLVVTTAVFGSVLLAGLPAIAEEVTDGWAHTGAGAEEVTDGWARSSLVELRRVALDGWANARPAADALASVGLDGWAQGRPASAASAVVALDGWAVSGLGPDGIKLVDLDGWVFSSLTGQPDAEAPVAAPEGSLYAPQQGPTTVER
ncbi:MAG: hypothetical protein ACRDKZ_02210 [Actinomycetota bacterium]